MASNRYLAEQAGVQPFVASKVANALALLGMVQKLPLPPYARRRYATRWVLCTPDPEGFRRRLELLKDVPLHQLNRELASELFGKTAAEEVFRHAPSSSKTNPVVRKRTRRFLDASPSDSRDP